MAVSFVIGRAGSGKTHRCIASIVEAMRQDPWGEPIFWIVPRQATFLAERELLSASGLGAIGRARVVSFESLAEEVLADCGGAAVPEVKASGRQMILGHLLRQHEKDLRFFGGVAHHSGLAARLDATLVELQSSGIEPNQLVVDLANRLGDEVRPPPHARESATERSQSSRQRAPGAPPNIAKQPALGTLAAKLHDLRLIFSAYGDYLGQDRLDQHRRLAYVLQCIEKSRLFSGGTVYVDGFAHFTQLERQMLSALGKACGRVEIMLLMDPGSALLRDPHVLPDEMSLFHSVELAYRKLYFAMRQQDVPLEQPVVILSDVHRFRSKSLALLEREMFAPRLSAAARRIRQAGSEPGGITLVEAQSRRAEVDAAARQIKWWAVGGMRYRQIAVLVRRLDDYGDLIAAAFAEHGIPYFIDRRRPAAHHPLITFIRQAFSIARGTWPHEAMMDLLKCGLGGVEAQEADRIENYVLQHRVRAGAWTKPWTFSERGAEISEEGQRKTGAQATEARQAATESPIRPVETIRRALIEGLSPWVALFASQEKIPARRIISALFALIERFNLRQTLAQWIADAEVKGRIEQHDEHQQVWSNVAELLDQMVDLLGDEQMTLDDFQEVAEAAFEQFDLALTPPMVDQVVIGQVDRTRSAAVGAAAVLGMNEGVSPRGPRDDSILSDADRRDLGERHLDIEPGTQRRLLDENLLGYIALTRAADQLWISRSLGDDAGNPLGPSPFWRRLQELFPSLHPIRVGESEDARDENKQTIESVGTPRQLAAALMRWARVPGVDPKGADGILASTYAWFRQTAREKTDNELAATLMRAWPALAYRNAAAISQPTAAALFGHPLQGSAARLETFAACPFSHFAHYGLGLAHREEGDVSAGDVGSVYHRVLQHLVTEMLRRRKTWDDLPADEQQKLIHQYTEQAGQELRDEILISSARNRYLLNRAERTLQQVVASQAAVERRGRFRPAHAKVVFGDGARLPALRVQTAHGNELRLSGSVDRVDCLDDGSKNGREATPFLVIDYKLGGADLHLDEVYYGLSLGLLTALLVIQANGAALNKGMLTPAAAFYVQLRRGLVDKNHPDEAIAITDPRFPLLIKPKGIFDGQYLAALDAGLETGSSDVVAVAIKKDGQFGSKDRSDLSDPDEFDGLLKYVRQKLAELADEIIAGDISVRPYRMAKQSPCARCSYQSVCRFERGVNRYKFLEGAKRSEVLQRAAEGAAKKSQGPQDNAGGRDL